MKIQFLGYGLPKELAKQLIELGPEYCDLFERTCELAFKEGLLKVKKEQIIYENKSIR